MNTTPETYDSVPGTVPPGVPKTRKADFGTVFDAVYKWFFY